MASTTPGYSNVLTFIALITWGPLLLADVKSAIFIVNSSDQPWTLAARKPGGRLAHKSGTIVVRRFQQYKRVFETELEEGVEETITIDSHKIIMIDFKNPRLSPPCERLWRLVDNQGTSKGSIAYFRDFRNPDRRRLVGPAPDPATLESDIARRVNFGLKSVEITADSW